MGSAVQPAVQLFRRIQGAGAGAGKPLFVNYKYTASALGAQIPVVIAPGQGRWLRIHGAFLNNVRIRICRNQGFLAVAHQLFAVAHHVFAPGKGQYLTADAAAPRRQQIGIAHLVKDARHGLARIATTQCLHSALPAVYEHLGFILVSGKPPQGFRNLKQPFKGIYIKCQHPKAQRTQILGLGLGFAAAFKLQDHIRLLRQHKLGIGAHVRADGRQGRKLRQIAVRSGTRHQEVASAQGQKNLVKRPIQGDDPLDGLGKGYGCTRVVRNDNGGGVMGFAVFRVSRLRSCRE